MPAGKGRYYTVKFRFEAPPANPAPNTSYVGATKSGTASNPFVFFVYRIYGSDFGNGPNSGGVPLPAITYYDASGNIVKHYDECQPYPGGEPPAPAHVQSFPSLPIPGPLANRHPQLSLSSNYHVPVGLLANPDVQYANVFYSARHGDLFVVRAKALTTPDTRNGQPVYAAGKDVRGFTVCGYNFYAGYANRCALDHEIPVDKDGYYTIVVSSNKAKPVSADTPHSVTWIPLGPYLDGQLTYRLFLRSDPKIQALASAISTGHASRQIAPYVPQMTYCSTRTFERGGWRACFRGSRHHGWGGTW